MPKMKTNKSVAKRFTVTATGKLNHSKCNKQHNTGKKTPKRKRNLRQETIVDSTMQNNMKRMLPYL
ncbi:MAG: 50S ribosomal protein L35 [Clostridiales bacterium]|jgi:large subunit ribosomal protein L35|nr:50S ribosomal protein L35 [Clostridiales bacterium]